MSVYDMYILKNREAINLAKDFNKGLKNKKEKSLSFKDYNNYFKKYVEAARGNTLGFDYSCYGQLLVNSDVVTNDEEEASLIKETKELLSSFVEQYDELMKKHEKINPAKIRVLVNIEK